MMARRVSIRGVRNMRDLGGLPTVNGETTRAGLIFRSARPSNAEEEDIEHLTARLGIRTIVDLRGKRNEVADIRVIYPVVTDTSSNAAGDASTKSGAAADAADGEGTAGGEDGLGLKTIPIKFMSKDVRNGMVVRLGWLRISAMLAGFGSAKMLSFIKSWMPSVLKQFVGRIKGYVQFYTLRHTLCKGELMCLAGDQKA